MSRETKTIQIGKHEVVVKSYATAREANDIQQAYFKGTKIELVGNQPKMSEVNPNIQFNVEEELIRQLLISFDGKQGDEALDYITNQLPVHEYNDLITELDSLVAKKKILNEQ